MGPPVGRYQRRREIAVAAQTTLWLGLPFLRIGGESALRLDIPTLTLHFFGTRMGLHELFPLVSFSLFLLFSFAAGTFLWGRVWCGYVCPQTALSELSRFTVGRDHRGWRLLGVAGVSTVVVAVLLLFFVPPREALERAVGGGVGPLLWGLWGVLTLLLFIDLTFVRQAFCARLCPYARLQGLLFDGETQVLAFNSSSAAQCGSCSACVSVCPVDIDLRRGLSDSCIACALCADRCEWVRGLRGKEALITYGHGSSVGPRRSRLGLLRRPAVIWPSLAAAVTLVFTVALVGSRAPFSLTVLPDPSRPAQEVSDGVEDWVLLALENHLQRPLLLDLGLEGPESRASIDPLQVELGPGEYRKVAARVQVLAPPPGPHEVTLTARVRGSDARLVRFGTTLMVLDPE